MKCKKCGKRIELRWVIQYIIHPIRHEKRYCMKCIRIEFFKWNDGFIFAGTLVKLPGESCLDVSGLYDSCCPLFKGFKCHTESFEFCPYKVGWRSCYYYLKHEGKKNEM